jgi:hypothetical protein
MKGGCKRFFKQTTFNAIIKFRLKNNDHAVRVLIFNMRQGRIIITIIIFLNQVYEKIIYESWVEKF